MQVHAVRLTAVLAVSCFACTHDGATAEGDGSTGDLDEPDVSLRVAVAPVDAVVWMPIFAVVDDAGAPRLESSAPLSLALGDAYPSRFTVTFDGAWVTTCGSAPGRIEIVSVDGAGFDRIDDVGFVVSIDDERDSEAIVHGILHRDDPGACPELGDDPSTPFELRVPVQVRRPAGAIVGTPAACADATTLRIQSGAGFAQDHVGMVPKPLDASGEPFFPDNATRTRSVEVVVTAAAGTELALQAPDDGLASLRVDGPPGAVSIAWTDRQVLGLEVVEAASIDAIDVAFGLLGFGGGALVLEPGATYGDQGFARLSSSIGVVARGLYVGADALCTLPRSGDFELVSNTPEVCARHDGLGHGDYLFDGAPLSVSADVSRSGDCRLEVHAPEFDGGVGLEVDLAVTLHNAEALLGVGDRD